jgi:hypothetical protein
MQIVQEDKIVLIESRSQHPEQRLLNVAGFAIEQRVDKAYSSSSYLFANGSENHSRHSASYAPVL